MSRDATGYNRHCRIKACLTQLYAILLRTTSFSAKAHTRGLLFLFVSFLRHGCVFVTTPCGRFLLQKPTIKGGEGMEADGSSCRCCKKRYYREEYDYY